MFKLNIFTGNFDEVGASSASPFFGPPVDIEADLPVPGVDGELRVVKFSRDIYQFNTVANNWKNVTKEYLDAVGSSPNSNGLSQTTSVNVDGIVEKHFQLQPANGSNPGVLTSSAQSIGGVKTFDATVKLANGIDSSTIGGTIGIGFTDAATINIGHTGATVNIQGTTNVIDVTNLEVTDKNITVNKNGPLASGSGSGIEVEENTAITGYAIVSPARTAWNLKAPASAGIVSIVPGAVGFTLDQGSHNPVSFSTPGLGITFNSGTQALSAQLASTTQPGLLSSTDFTTFNNKADSNLGNLTSPTAINQTLLPDTDSSRNIGNSSLKFNAIFANGIYNGTHLAYNVGVNMLLDSTGANSIKVNTRELTDSSNLAAISYGNRTLNDTTGNAVLNHSGPNIDVLTRKIVNVVDPTANQDAATKKYVDDGLVALNAANKTLSNLTTTSINADLIPNADDGYSIGAPNFKFSAYLSTIFDDNNSPAIAFGVSTRDLVATSGNVVASFDTDDLSLNNNKIINLSDPTNPQEAATKAYVDGLTSFSTGDIAPSSFNLVNNQAIPANVTGLLFNPAVVRSFDILLSIYINATTPVYEAIRVTGINKGTSFDISQTSTGDSSGVLLSITNLGQFQYTSSNSAGFVSGVIKFRAITTPV